MPLDFELKNGVLTVFRGLDTDYDVAFDKACNDLVASEYTDLMIDLSKVRSITSTCIGMMAAAYIRAEADKKKLSIVAQGAVLKVLKLAGFENLMKITDSGRFHIASK